MPRRGSFVGRMVHPSSSPPRRPKRTDWPSVLPQTQATDDGPDMSLIVPGQPVVVHAQMPGVQHGLVAPRAAIDEPEELDVVQQSVADKRLDEGGADLIV